MQQNSVRAKHWGFASAQESKTTLTTVSLHIARCDFLCVGKNSVRKKTVCARMRGGDGTRDRGTDRGARGCAQQRRARSAYEREHGGLGPLLRLLTIATPTTSASARGRNCYESGARVAAAPRYR